MSKHLHQVRSQPAKNRMFPMLISSV